MTDRWLIAGLGNPGPQYAGHRHNAGFMVAEVLAARMGVTLRRDRSGAAVATGQLAGVPVTLARPLTFMNLSGRPVAALRAFYKIPPERVLILHDELDLPFGDVRFCPTGGVTAANAGELLALSNVVCVGGSWLTPADAVAGGDWARITQLAREASQLPRKP